MKMLEIYDAPFDLGTHVETWGPFDDSWTEEEIDQFAGVRCMELNAENGLEYWANVKEIKTPDKELLKRWVAPSN